MTTESAITDLFHLDRPLTQAERRKLRTRKHGHAAPPGTGPAGETCGSCEHLARKSMGKTYLKCWRMQSAWTGGYGTDVRARDEACRLWEAVKPEEASELIEGGKP